MLSCLRGYWMHARPAQRMAYLTGGVLVAVGLAHGLAWLVVGGSAQGPLSWRKPTTFGLSFGLTAIALGWVSGFLALTDRALRLTLGAVVASFSLEVAWVAVQHARGVVSHFNESSPLDAVLFRTAGVAVMVGVAVIAFYAVRAFTASTAPPAMTLALRAGLLILLVSMGTGVWMILRGVAFDRPPATLGAAGSIKLLHAVGMHAVQVLPALAWLASFGRLGERMQRDLVALATVGYLLSVGLAAVLAGSGTAARTAGPLAATVALAAVLCLLTVAAAALVSLPAGAAGTAPTGLVHGAGGWNGRGRRSRRTSPSGGA